MTEQAPRESSELSLAISLLGGDAESTPFNPGPARAAAAIRRPPADPSHRRSGRADAAPATAQLEVTAPVTGRCPAVGGT